MVTAATRIPATRPWGRIIQPWLPFLEGLHYLPSCGSLVVYIHYKQTTFCVFVVVKKKKFHNYCSTFPAVFRYIMVSDWPVLFSNTVVGQNVMTKKKGLHRTHSVVYCIWVVSRHSGNIITSLVTDMPADPERSERSQYFDLRARRAFLILRRVYGVWKQNRDLRAQK